jgi:hypothetical protein
MYYYHSNDSQTDTNSNNVHSNYDAANSPLFSQPLDPSTLEELPTDFLNNHHHFDPNSLLNEPLFNMNNNPNWDFYQQQEPTDPQEAILLSDPNFVRQHQLLQDQQKEMHTRLRKDEAQEIAANPTNVQASLLEPNLETSSKANNSLPAHTVEENSKNKQQKRSNNRRQQVVGKSSADQQEDDTKIDHQRRFNELQARFRVNYARKPNQQQQPLMNNKAFKKPVASASPIPQQQQQQKSPSPVSAYQDDQTLIAPLNNTHAKPVEQLLSTSPMPAINTPTAVKTPSVAIGGLTSEDPNNNVNNTPPTNSLSFSFPSRTMPIQIQRVARQNNPQPFDAESHQKQLDSQLDKVDFDDITVSELKEMLRQRGKPATGKKAILLQRLQEEREIAKGGRSPGGARNHRHSQPLPFSRSFSGNYPDSPQQQQRPRSFQGASSPVTIQQNSHHDSSFAASSPSSMPSFLPPGSPGGQLHRSIANMHIGSPPANISSSRRYSPYSPRLSSSPKPVHHEYSTSAPSSNNDLASSPGPYNNQSTQPSYPSNSSSNSMMLSSSYSTASRTATTPTGRYYNNPKTYKPFMSSALATPDREEDINPFDSYYAGGGDPPIKEEDIGYSEINTTNNDSSNSNYNHSNMDWTDPTALELLLQQGND